MMLGPPARSWPTQLYGTSYSRTTLYSYQYYSYSYVEHR